MFYLGIDVAKAKLDCCLLDSQAPSKLRRKIVTNCAGGFEQLLHWLTQQGAPPGAIHALLEGTGPYHESAATALYGNGVRVSILNPAQVRDFGKGLGLRSKTERLDSELLARFGLLQQPVCWQRPSAALRQLRALLTRQQALSQDLQRERNRLEKAQATDTSELIHQSLQKHMAFLKEQLAQLQKDIDQHIEHNPGLKQDLALLQSIPGVGPKVGTHLLCVMRSNTFDSAEQLAAYLGVVPIERQSGTSVHGRARLSKAGPSHIRALLFMAAVVGKGGCNRPVEALYQRLLAKGKSKMAALGAAMRKIVHLCFGVLKNRTPYRENISFAS